MHAALTAAVVAGIASLLCLGANLVLLPRLSRAPGLAGDPPRVSVIIPARNEEREVERAVRSHLAQTYPDFEVIAVDDGSTDATGQILARLGREDARVRAVSAGDLPAGWLGKPHALDRGAREASGDVLAFVDADVRYDPRALSEAIGLMKADSLDFLTLLPRFETFGFWESVLMPYLEAAVFLAPAFLANRRIRWFAVGAGAGNLIRREAYASVGGHAALRDSVVDDVRLAFRVKAAGWRVAVARAEDRVAVRMYRGAREIVDGFTKNVAYVFQGAFALPVFALTLVLLGMAILPAAVIAAALFGAPVAPVDLRLAVAGYALAVAGRVALARSLGNPVWPAVAHPLTAAIWSAILGRSLFQRFVRRRLTWRGRDFDARGARF